MSYTMYMRPWVALGDILFLAVLISSVVYGMLITFAINERGSYTLVNMVRLYQSLWFYSARAV